MPIAELIRPRMRDIGGGFTVRRLLPALPTRSVGPFVFFDHFGPVTARPDDELRRAPASAHRALDGHLSVRGRDDAPGQPRLGAADRARRDQLDDGGTRHRPFRACARRFARDGVRRPWIAALGRAPEAHEETDPAFFHTPAAALPAWSERGIRARVLVGNAFGRQSPVKTYSTTLYVDVAAEPGIALALPSEPGIERAVYSVDRPIVADGSDVPAFTMAVLAPGRESTAIR